MCRQKRDGDKKSKDYIKGEKYGTITVSIYKEKKSNSPIFYIQADNENVLPILYIIEDTLALY